MKITIDVLGVVPKMDTEERRKVKNYPNGDGGYLVKDNDMYIGFIIVGGEKEQHPEKGEIYKSNNFCWIEPWLSKNISICEHDFDLSTFISNQLAEHSQKQSVFIEDRLNELKDAIDERLSKTKDILQDFQENGGGKNGISEKTLLSALEIITKQK